MLHYPGSQVTTMIELNEIQMLLIEDDPNDVELMQISLHKCSPLTKVFVVRDGVEALDFIYGRGAYAQRKLNYNLKVIMLDLKLPRMDGFDVLRDMKSNDFTKTVPVVVLSSSQEEHDILKCYQLGANSYLVKPGNFNEYVQMVSELEHYWLILNKTVQ